jgi:hypothetical protein
MAIDNPWRHRMRALGVTGEQLATLLDQTPTSISNQWTRPQPVGSVRAAIRALEIMTPEQREKWLSG